MSLTEIPPNNTASFIYQIRPLFVSSCKVHTFIQIPLPLSFRRIQCENSVFPALIPQNFTISHSYFLIYLLTTILYGVSYNIIRNTGERDSICPISSSPAGRHQSFAVSSEKAPQGLPYYADVQKVPIFPNLRCIRYFGGR